MRLDVFKFKVRAFTAKDDATCGNGHVVEGVLAVVTKITTTAHTNTRNKVAPVDPKVITPVNSKRLASSAMQVGAIRVARR